MLCPLLYSLYTYDCKPRHNSNIIIKFADDTTVMGLISDDDELPIEMMSSIYLNNVLVMISFKM